MIVLDNLENMPRLKGACLTIGNFDGLHLGHQKIMNSMDKAAGNNPVIAVSFQKAPIEYLDKSKFKGYLFPPDDKAQFLEKTGINYLISLDFQKTANLSAIDFLRLLLSKVELLHMFVGYNFQFGRGNSGNVELLSKLAQASPEHFKLTVVDKVIYRGEPISSSRIRDQISGGFMIEASEMLGRPYYIKSTGVKGDGIGGKIGFPTLNMKIPGQVLPREGIYFTLYPFLGKLYPAMTYIGRRPTLNAIEMRLETNILNFEEFGEDIKTGDLHTIYFIQRTRDEKKFHNLDELQKSIYNDRKIILDTYSRYTIPKEILNIK